MTFAPLTLVQPPSASRLSYNRAVQTAVPPFGGCESLFDIRMQQQRELTVRTTINLDEDLLRRAKRQAALHHRSLSAFVSDALREALARRPAPRERSIAKLPTVRGRLLPGINCCSFAELNEIAQER